MAATRTILACVLLPAIALCSLTRAGQRAPVNTRAEFFKFDAGYRAKIGVLRKKIDALQTNVQALEAEGKPARCAAQMLTELRWRAANTADFIGVERQAVTLVDEIARRRSGEADRVDAQDASDGAWGRCYTEWFLRLDASYDAISELGQKPPASRAAFLDRVNDPDALEAALRRGFVSNIAADGINRRREYNTLISDVMRLVLADRPIGYAWKTGVKQRMLALIHGDLRNPETGMWGVRHVINGAPVYADDISITFHIVKYLNGAISDWPKLIDGLIAIRDLPYPQGWRQEDRYLNHDIYDVATLFRMGWRHASEAQRAAIRREVKALLEWSLATTIRSDGSVVLDRNDDSIETAYYFAIGFLDEVGYFDPRKRFWTDERFPAGPALANAMRAKIEAALKNGAGGEGGVYYRSALQRLAAAEQPGAVPNTTTTPD
ncbi:hypothetical protein [Terrarubrum flagellatum]|uniref:hypothetical protein n=1 Tax=Terrirubrum flagellatum TaxID=2895980 RepID=UPI003145399E